MSRPRVWISPLALLLGACALWACAGADIAGPREPSPAARLLLDCEIEDATVWIDDRYVGEVGRVGTIAVAPGMRRIEIRHDHYHTFYARIPLEPHERRRIGVHLARKLR